MKRGERAIKEFSSRSNLRLVSAINFLRKYVVWKVPIFTTDPLRRHLNGVVCRPNPKHFQRRLVIKALFPTNSNGMAASYINNQLGLPFSSVNYVELLRALIIWIYTAD
jgi:hypothetical protein